MHYAPNKKDAATHQREGTWRGDRHAGCILPIEVPAKPGELKGYAEAAWNVLAEHLVFSGLVSRVDGKALQILCESIDLYIEAEDAIAEHGVLIWEATGHGGQKCKANPACSVRGMCWKEIMHGLARFGLAGPASRTGIKPGGGANDEEEQRVMDLLRGTSTN